MFSPDVSIAEVDPELAAALAGERGRQEGRLSLVASENYASPAVMSAQGSVLTNKYANGYPGARFYGGCEFADEIERAARVRACELFGADFANVQPYSGSQANHAVFSALLNPGDVVLGMRTDDGGHPTHGDSDNASGKLYRAVRYGLRESDEDIDYDAAARLAKQHKPKLVVCGASSFSREIDFARFRAVADSVGALLMADVAHHAGLIAAKVFPSPVGVADVATMSSHKTLGGPRGGLILANAQFAKAIDAAVYPGAQGCPLMHVVAAKAVALREAATAEFAERQRRVVANARVLAKVLADGGARIVSGGTDCHMLIADLRGLGLDGERAKSALERARVTADSNPVPGDAPGKSGGVRLGTAAATTRGFGANEMRVVGECVLRVLKSPDDGGVLESVAREVSELCAANPIYAAGDFGADAD